MNRSQSSSTTRLWNWRTVCCLAIASLAVTVVAGCGGASDQSTAGNSATGKTSGGAATGSTAAKGAAVELLNIACDPTRELWKEMNVAFATAYEKESGSPVSVKQSHGGSGSQARAVIDGLKADVVTLALWSDIDAIRSKGLIADDWESKFANNAVPYTSTIVFVVRKGNPKTIKDWPDLIRDDVEVVTPSPKTSGNGRLAFLAAWASVVTRGGSDEEATKFMKTLYQHVPVLDTAARASTTTFSQKEIGDVHLTWENEAYLEVQESEGKLEIVYPPISILAEPPVAVVDQYVDQKSTRAAAEAYLKFAYTPEGQRVFAKHYYRPIDTTVLAENADRFPKLELIPISKIAKSWGDSQKRFFSDGGLFDQLNSGS